MRQTGSYPVRRVGSYTMGQGGSLPVRRAGGWLRQTGGLPVSQAGR